MGIYQQLARRDIYLPALWNYEIRNILIVNERRGRVTPQAADAALAFLVNLGLTTDHGTTGMMRLIWLDSLG